MPIKNINGINIYYELHGQGDPLILIAGYSCDHTFWGLMLKDLAKKFQILILDNRGVGQTHDPYNNDFTLENIADDIITLANYLGFKKPYILGQSMGGAIAQIIARKYPDKINKLIILNSAAKFNLRTLKAVESLLNLGKINTPLDILLDAALPWFFSSHHLSQQENISYFKAAVINNPNPQTIPDQEKQFKAILTFDSRAWLKEIKAETLVIAATDDIVDLPSESKYIAENIPNAKFLIIPGGHSSPIEQPQIVNQHILNFFVSNASN